MPGPTPPHRVAARCRRRAPSLRRRRAADRGPARRFEPGERRLRDAPAGEQNRSNRRSNSSARSWSAIAATSMDGGASGSTIPDRVISSSSPRKSRRSPTSHRTSRRPRPRGSPGGRGSWISPGCLRFASSTTCPKPTRPARAAAEPRPGSARTSDANSNSSRPGSNCDFTSSPSMPARTVATG